MTPQLTTNLPAYLVLDNFYRDPDEVRNFALRQEFQPNPEHHKGQRTRNRFLFPGLRERFDALLGITITSWEDQGFNGVFQFCIGGDTIVFHSDAQRWAGVVYLTPNAPPEAGTTLYRSRELKCRSADEAIRRVGGSDEHALRRMYQGKLLDRTAWETVDVLGNVYNRLALWDARLVHAASCYFGTAKENARLFQMFFFG